jgi:hypothetical protein
MGKEIGIISTGVQIKLLWNFIWIYLAHPPLDSQTGK